MSVRVEYEVETLRKQIAARRDDRIKAAEREYAEAIDLPAQREAWRTEQEKRVRSLARRLKHVPDNELASFKVPSYPTQDGWRSPEYHRDNEIEKANESHDAALRRLEGMRAPNGVLSLTRNMLREWFGL